MSSAGTVEPDGRDASIVIPCYTDRRWASLLRAVRSATDQRPAPRSVIVVTDHNRDLRARLAAALPDVTVLENRFERGVSGARNTGALACETPFVVWLDDDATARPGWLRSLLRPFADPTVVGTGGSAVPQWVAGRPRWYTDEFLWVVGASYRGQPTGTSPVRNVWSCAMAVRREAFLRVGGFRLGFGKVGSRSCPEDTDLCLRMGALGRWMYVPASRIDHLVPAERGTFGYFLRRCYLEGRGKVAMSRLQRRESDLSDERTYLSRTLPGGVARELVGVIGPDCLGALARTSGMLAGIGAAVAGAAVESACGRSGGPTPSARVSIEATDRPTHRAGRRSERVEP